MGIGEFFEEIWEGFLEGIDYFISGEIFLDINDFISGFFEGIKEFSIIGLIYGLVLVTLVYLFRKSIFIGVHGIVLQLFFYLITFIIGYLIGKRFLEQN